MLEHSHQMCTVLSCCPQERRRDAPTGDVEGASVEELNQKIHTLEKEKNKEEEYRNYMQLERVRGVGSCRCSITCAANFNYFLARTHSNHFALSVPDKHRN